MFRYGDMFVMSAKKDAIVNMGGLLGVREDGELAEKVKSNVISFEGYLTYGGLAGRDLEALAVGLEEGLDMDWQRYRVGQIQYLGDQLEEAGVPFQSPVGGLQCSLTPVACCRIWRGNSTQGTRWLTNCTWMQEFDPATSVLTLWTGTPSPMRSNKRPSSSLG